MMMSNELAGDAVVIERSFDAPIGVVWQMWTDPEHFRVWYGPPGATVGVAEMDPRVGGRRLISMAFETPEGSMAMWFAGEYLEVDPPRRLVYTDAVADEYGNVLPAAEAGLPDGHPVVTRVVVELADQGARTRMSMTHLGVPAGSPGEAGWLAAFDQLDTALAAGR